VSAAPSETRRLKYAVEGCFNGVWGDDANGVDDLVVARVADFNRERGCVEFGDNPTVRAIPQSARNRRVLSKGDLLIEKSGGGEQMPVGNVVLFNDERSAVCSNFVARMPVAEDCDSRYVSYVFRTLYSEGRNVTHIKQTSGIQNLDSESYLNEKVWLPSMVDQERIANFLDDKTARIDALIAEKESLVAALLEYRKSRITEAITKGVRPFSKSKPSGIEWLGNIPAHWEMKKFKHLGEALIGLTYSPDDVVDAASGTLVLRSSNVQQGQLCFEDNVYVNANIPDDLRTRVGDILICSRNGSRALIGKNATIGQASAGMTFGAFMTVFRSPFNEFIRWSLNSHLFDFHSASFFTSTINQLTTGNLKSIEIPFPPLIERQEITSYLFEKFEQIEKLVLHAQLHVARLREYRSSLISAAVTGQLDVGAYKDAA
jgi:type I restriction enzyme S subunit